MRKTKIRNAPKPPDSLTREEINRAVKHVKNKEIKMICKKPDRDVPELLCGCPLPCPYHTVLIDTEPTPPTITIPATLTRRVNLKSLNRLKKIASIIKE